MYQYVTDKVFLKESYSLCADLVNQLVQALKKEGIQTMMTTVGSKKRGLVTQNEQGKIDFDFNLWILVADDYSDCRRLKFTIMRVFDNVLQENGHFNIHSHDSTSAINTDYFRFKKGNKTPFKMDICIVKEDRYGCWNRLVHEKTGNAIYDRWYWNQGPNGNDIGKKEEFLKSEAKYWNEVREVYLHKKNMYLSRNDHDHPSFKVYIESINEVYSKYQLTAMYRRG